MHTFIFFFLILFFVNINIFQRYIVFYLNIYSHELEMELPYDTYVMLCGLDKINITVEKTKSKYHMDD